MIPVDITDRQVILIDDVLYTGRTIRAAIDNLVVMASLSGWSGCLGRPWSPRAAYRADYVGKNIPTSQTERLLLMTETDVRSRFDMGVIS